MILSKQHRIERFVRRYLECYHDDMNYAEAAYSMNLQLSAFYNYVDLLQQNDIDLPELRKVTKEREVVDYIRVQDIIDSFEPKNYGVPV